jgi:hypothetical protein
MAVHFHCMSLLCQLIAKFARRTLEFMPDPENLPGPPHPSEPRRTHPGPSWGLMLFVIFFAMLVAIGIAWAFVTPLLHRH